MAKKRINKASLALTLDTTPITDAAAKTMAAAAEVVTAINLLVGELRQQRESASRRRKTLTEALATDGHVGEEA